MLDKFVYDQKRSSLNSFIYVDGNETLYSPFGKGYGGPIIGLDDCPGKILNSPGKIWHALSRDSTSTADSWNNDYLIYCYYDCDYPPTNASLYTSYCSNSAYSKYKSYIVSEVFPTTFRAYYWGQSTRYYTAPSSYDKLFVIHFKVKFDKQYYVASKLETRYSYIIKIHFNGSLNYKETDWFLGFRITL